MAYGTTITVPTITGSHSSFAAVIICDGTRNDLPTLAYNGANSFANGGGDLKAYTDSGKTTQLAVDVVRFVTGATPDIEVHVKVPTYATSSTIYLEADDIQTVQPAASSTYGSEAVWVDDVAVYHLQSDAADSTGINDGTIVGATLEAGGGFSFSGTDRIELPDAVGDALAGEHTIFLRWTKTSAAGSGHFLDTRLGGSTGVDIDYSSSGAGVLGGAYDSTVDPNSFNVLNGVSTPDAGEYRGWFVKDADSVHIYINETSAVTTPFSGSTPRSTTTKLGNQANNADPLGSGIVLHSARVHSASITGDRVSAEQSNQSATTAYYTNDGWADAGGGGGTTSVSKTSTLIWNALNETSKTATLRWDALNEIQTTATLRWDVLNGITKDATLLWAVLNSTQVDASVKWNVLNAIQADATLIWNVESSLASVTKATTLRWDALNETQQTATVRWNVLNAVSKQSTILWDALNAAQIDATLRWDVLNSITQEITARWDVLGLASVTKTATMRWDVIEEIGTTTTLRWSILDESATPDLIEGSVQINSLTRQITLQSLTRKITIN